MVQANDGHKNFLVNNFLELFFLHFPSSVKIMLQCNAWRKREDRRKRKKEKQYLLTMASYEKRLEPKNGQTAGGLLWIYNLILEQVKQSPRLKYLNYKCNDCRNA